MRDILKVRKELVDRAAYHPVPPVGSDGELAWEQHDIAVRQLLAERSVWQRWRMRLDPRPLLKRRGVSGQGDRSE